ncbi:HAMP domain-containing histidine kinase [Lacinutrix sp. C3R15]|uniref:sensor histidine kinase n=1 Tax=Flavobacteriaceae TaxID=49546 RepID=UPI001C0998E7|nr:MULTISPECIES: HAMP domain-containing sensor histidine kinase [Flavobacteriaceae]MBU2940609.1 HAMP domain-containing histidine kinase [Lacinutrix sp. C3R15]MDO6623927.1 HAMP domain-containing sensor histidine kinase [Oceanihabitans sp. 1_MG-2023]
MSKKLFILLIILMSLSLIGIISVQAYYIKNSVDNKKEQFNFNVKKALSYTTAAIENKELDKYYTMYQQLAEQQKQADTVAIKNLFIVQQNQNTNETIVYKSGIFEENYTLSSAFFDIGLDRDSINIQKILSNSETKIYTNASGSNELNMNPVLSISNSGRLTEAEKITFEKSFRMMASRMPIHQRVLNKEINRLLKKQLIEDNINIDFQFAIYDNDLATKVQSEAFELQNASTFSVPIFENELNANNYRLLVNFPEHNKFIWSSIITMMLLSVVFTTIIIIAYASALLQLFKQRKISEIKTDFINNMTHEFKTPIATINLALDAIKNPKIIDDKSKVLRYLNMIKEENKRMHAQVENVLRISKLEKNELNISKENVNLHDLIEDAITHVELIIEDKKGYLKTNLNAEKTSVLANDTHFTNVIVNILDNAIKYSPGAPEIEVSTENVGENILLKIKDHGSGMSKVAQKRVFEKFYREHTGDIHNVKGHGLGLAYVKRMVDDHQGYISVESEKEKGSTFTIRLPLIS